MGETPFHCAHGAYEATCDVVGLGDPSGSTRSEPQGRGVSSIAQRYLISKEHGMKYRALLVVIGGVVLGTLFPATFAYAQG